MKALSMVWTVFSLAVLAFAVLSVVAYFGVAWWRQGPETLAIGAALVVVPAGGLLWRLNSRS